MSSFRMSPSNFLFSSSFSMLEAIIFATLVFYAINYYSPSILIYAASTPMSTFTIFIPLD